MRLLLFVIFLAFLLLWACGKLHRLAKSEWRSLWHAFFLVQKLGLRIIRYLWLFDLQSWNSWFFAPSPWCSTYHSLLTPKNWFGLKTQTIQYQNWAKMAIFSQEPNGVAIPIYFQTRFFQSTSWPNSAYNAIFGVQIALVQSRQQHFKIE